MTSTQPNPISAEGVATAVQFRAGQVWTTSYSLAAVKLPPATKDS